MRIGLIRHFEVKRGYPNKFVTSRELMQWVDEYDASDVIENEIQLGEIEWKRCYSSDLPRAKITAKKAFEGKIIYLEELREITLSPLLWQNIRLPLFVHLLLIRIAWFFNHKSQKESKNEVMNRIKLLLNEIMTTSEDVLIVGHGGIMMFMRNELVKRGFKGPTFKRPENGKLYVFEKETLK